MLRLFPPHQQVIPQPTLGHVCLNTLMLGLFGVNQCLSDQLGLGKNKSPFLLSFIMWTPPPFYSLLLQYGISFTDFCKADPLLTNCTKFACEYDISSLLLYCFLEFWGDGFSVGAVNTSLFSVML